MYQLVKIPNREISATSITRALKTVIHLAAARVVELGESPATVDFVATEGVKIPQAPLKEIDSLGAAAVLEELSKMNHEMAEISLAPPELLTAMAREEQTFFRDGQANPWLLSLVKAPTPHASH
jgi:3-hydroxyacyl-CoA dehydrogenase